MTIETGIKKAIEGGYQTESRKDIQMYDEQVISANVYKILLDPKFWEALSYSTYGEKGFKAPKNNYKLLMMIFMENIIKDQSLEEAFNNATK